MSQFIYFAGSIRGGRQDAELYSRLVKKLEAYGTVLTEHVASMTDKDIKESYDDNNKDKEVHDRDMKWLNQADVVVAEVTQASLGVGYELGRAIAMDKRVLCLYRPQADKNLSCMIRGADNEDTFIVKDYKEAEVDEIFKEFFANDEEAEAEDDENGTE